jgi:hypothetical protein
MRASSSCDAWTSWPWAASAIRVRKVSTRSSANRVSPIGAYGPVASERILSLYSSNVPRSSLISGSSVAGSIPPSVNMLIAVARSMFPATSFWRAARLTRFVPLRSVVSSTASAMRPLAS